MELHSFHSRTISLLRLSALETISVNVYLRVLIFTLNITKDHILISKQGAKIFLEKIQILRREKLIIL